MSAENIEVYSLAEKVFGPMLSDSKPTSNCITRFSRYKNLAPENLIYKCVEGCSEKSQLDIELDTIVNALNELHKRVQILENKNDPT